MKGILGRKVGMTQVFEEGLAIPVTVIEVGPCYVTQKKDLKSDGYTAIQIGFDETSHKRISKGELQHLKQNQIPALRHLSELRVNEEDLAGYTVGQKLDAEIFAVGELVDVIGTSKGRGFQGGIKRHNFNRQPKSHGASDRVRAPGSAGSGTTPGRTMKGQRGPGHMGNRRVTVQSLSVVRVDAERNMLVVRGAIPGPKGGLVFVRGARKQG
ncbi:MAG: 50S ribosomal protein L3 [Anaerolineae bacterium]|nr:50S ribosomal protein L3 [Anaerolineae bacterium]MCB9132777.1 50S ribosomal protein L3 [Anaerolineales bacterium]MCB0227757.1 50S ribosomal protein L3 [Anaerolineae bacterium]MCB0232753.1 50S ribosomal protein L3 [Anaerolineae bacterium]MCB0238305.1 50S ribosomal protein L3 [Anaerolineae bacterium]